MPGEATTASTTSPPSSPMKPTMPHEFRTEDDYIPVGCYGRGISQAQPLKVPAEAVGELVKSLHLTEPRWASAAGQLSIAFLLLIVNIVLLITLPWYLTPLAWALAGVTLSNLFVIAHDCVHNTFTSNKFANRVIGEICMLPLGQPFAAYKQRHLKAYRPKRRSDAAPARPTSDDELSTDEEGNHHTEDGGYDPGLAEIPPPMHNALVWFRDTYRPKTTKKTRRSVAQSQALVFSFLTVLIPSLLYAGGLRAVLKYWLLPLLAYRLTYRSYFTVITNNVGAYIPTEVNTKLASYNLTKLASNLQSKYGEANTSITQLVKHYAKRINWINVSIIFGTPLISLYGCYTTKLTWPTAIWSLCYYFFSGLGITAGYHRLWAHRAYDASFPVKLFLLLGGSAALEGSLKWWAGGHRVHHRYTDTPKDPYNSKGGFWYAHVGWMLVHPRPENKAYADIRDLNADPLIRFQHKYYLLFGPTMAFLVPALVAHFGWNDFWGGFFYAGYARLVFVHHNTFCVNSVAHYFGEQTFDDERTPRDNWINALLTFGEGYHNFHHEFPNDYRNGLKWYDYDPTKWLIAAFGALGLTYNLKEFNDNAIRMGKIHMMDKHAAELKKKVHMPPEINSLPQMSWLEFRERCAKGGGYEQLAVVDGVVHDVTAFVEEHPGGKQFIKMAVGTDATKHFNGSTGIYRHSNAARNVLAGFRIARLEGEEAQQKPEVAEAEIKQVQQPDAEQETDVHDASDPSLQQDKQDPEKQATAAAAAEPKKTQ